MDSRHRIHREWKNDIPKGELYELRILGDRTVVASYGRTAHSSGCKIVSWDEFRRGEMDDLVENTMGMIVLHEAKEYLKSLV